MDRPDLPDDSRWAPLNADANPKEERPYRECPNCGRHRYRWVYFLGLLRSDRGYQECKECRYRETPDA